MSPFTISSGTRQPWGDRFETNIRVSAVTEAGDFITTGVDRVDRVTGVAPMDSMAGVQVSINSQTAGGAEDDLGDIHLRATTSGLSSEVTDVWLTYVSGQ